MKKLLWVCALLIPAAANAGVDLSWNDCAGANAQQNKNFLCTGTANQTYVLPLYFKIPEALPSFVGIRMDLDLQSLTPGPLAPFWHYEQGGCNRPAVGVSGIGVFDNIQSAPTDCQAYSDPWGGDGTQGFEGIGAYLPDNSRPGNGHFILGVAHSSSVSLLPATNYYAAQMNLNNRNKTNCAGCNQQVVIVWNSATLESNDGHPPLEISFPDKFGNCVSINGASAGSCAGVPTKNTTWGRVKSMYRN